MVRSMLIARRWASSSASSFKPGTKFNTFDRKAKLAQRTRAASLTPELSKKTEYLRDEVATRTIERLAFITRDFTKLLDLGAHLGNLLKSLCMESEIPAEADAEQKAMIKELNEDRLKVRNKIKEYVMVDSSKEMLERDAEEPFNTLFPGKIVRVVADEETFNNEEYLQKENQYDIVVSNLSMHWINDLPSAFAKINKLLAPDGVFVCTVFGEDTIYELRTSLQLAEMERRGGISPRVSPLIKLDDVNSLLSRAGFKMLTIDSEEIVVGGFPDIVAVCEDIQGMGELNAVLSRPGFMPRDLLLAANEIYKTLHGEEGPDGKVTLPVTFNVIFMIGWKHSDAQPQPLERGTGQIDLKQVL
ncbi:uncharacterized protein KQ657_004194 [Scheffersomyces spartinae]|uniref:Methyltransferase type 11 domain-containing protein n=1 Tax=Scheffersomyces spartinae TaxID=45513 RepID=A0A9P7VC44_9ASCO|nr:uncharacterized protein KQ657_004194 [Scheffersomyces spartinae]KAG7195078.1 hypothetical protein KQ657_004194 [Scheffersomyces spartinae]